MNLFGNIFGDASPAGAGGTVPSASDVRSGVTVGFGTGTLVVPAAQYVLNSQTFDNGTAGTLTLPAAANVLSGVTYGTGGTGSTGNVALPSTANVRSGVAFGATSGLVGTYDPVTGNYSDPGVAHVQAEATYKFGGATLTGSYDPITGNYTDPGVTHVQAGVSYRFAGGNLVGTLSGGTVPGYALTESGGTGFGAAPILFNGNPIAADAFLVLDPAGKPIANASVVAYASTDAAHATPLDSTATGPDGRWDAPLRLASGSYLLVIGFPGYTPAVETVVTVP